MERHFREWADLIDPSTLPRTSVRSVAELAGAVEDPRLPLPERVAAGAVLAVLGDPRIPRVPELVPVPGGEVRVGLPAGQVDRVVEAWRHVGVERSWIEKECPEHLVRITDFQIGRHPVTNSQYLAFLRETGYPQRPSTWYLGAYPWERANHPVAGLRAVDADAYVGWLAEATGRPFRLPTEAEWEHAARGFDGREYPWGDGWDPQRANTRETGLHTTTPVGAFPTGRGPWGTDDMAGNVEEYVGCEYRPYPGGQEVADDLVYRLRTYRITRGGSFARYGDLARTRRRHGPHPGPLYPCGLRVACDAAGGAE